jgi:predicted RNA-binding protein YlxR (DUF448 family)
VKAGHIPIRTCVGCRKRRPKEEMIRFTAAGVDSARRSGEGRGMYICPSAACVDALHARMDVRKRLGAAAYARVLQSLETVTAEENCLDGPSLGHVISDECHGGVAFG